jgi:protein involved in polysaccharide export with SLBB domain
MKLLKSALLLLVCHTVFAAGPTAITADPNLTGAAPLPSIISGKTEEPRTQQGLTTHRHLWLPLCPVACSAHNYLPLSARPQAQVWDSTQAMSLVSAILSRFDCGGIPVRRALTVDPKGNIFLPNIGPLKVSGMTNAQLNNTVTSKIKEVYTSNVNVYASLLQAQPVKVFVTGYVRSPGLYGGVASDSLLSYLSKAGGVDSERGSYVDIIVKRGKSVISRVNLYDFLLNGKLGLSQFVDGDTIVVGPRQHTFSVEGDVFNSYDFEFANSTIPVTEALSWARPKPGATHMTIIRQQGTVKRSEYYPLSSAAGRSLQDGDRLIVSSDRYAGTIQVRVDGAHSGEHAIVLPYGSTMRQVLSQIRPNSMSQMKAIQLYRTSVAERQKEMLNLSLQKLEEASLSAQSSTQEEARLRMQEAQLVSRFVNKARAVVPKGQVVLSESNIDSVLLEDGDVIMIPEKTRWLWCTEKCCFRTPSPGRTGWMRMTTSKMWRADAEIR